MKLLRVLALLIACVPFDQAALGQGFAALVSPPRFDLSARPGKTVRAVIEVSNRTTTAAKYKIHTSDWTLTPSYSVRFQDDLMPGSCRPWVAIERPEVVVPAGGVLRYRFEVAIPPQQPAGECRFAVMVEGAEPSIARTAGVELPVTGRIGVIVYVAIGDSAPELVVLGPDVAPLNGADVPVLRVHNGGNAHTRLSGFLSGTDAKGISYDFTPSDFPVLPGGEWRVFLTPSNASDEHPKLTFPVTVRGTLDWGRNSISVDQKFE